jgi:tRNA threonylcarbamoyladenosine biosynthesis protein TsaE
MQSFNRHLATPDDTLAVGSRLSAIIAPGTTIHLHGELGAGKTTLVRGLLRGLGYSGRVKSPTFSLLEPYTLPKLYLYHFDFYRILNNQTLEDIGFREYFNQQSICIIEWPDHILGLPIADLNIRLQMITEPRPVETMSYDLDSHNACGRQLVIAAPTPIGKNYLAMLARNDRQQLHIHSSE